MNRLAYYLFRQFLVAVLFSILALTMVVWFSQSVRLLSLVINAGGSIWSFVKMMLLVMPTFLPLTLPLSLVVGCLFVYYRLTVENEIHVMRAVGLSPWQLAKPAIALAALIACIAYVMTVWVAPKANHEMVRLKYQLANDYSMLLLRTGNFHDIKDGLSFYARDRGKDGDLEGILIHDTRKEGHPVTIMAESGEMVRTEKGPNVLVKNGIRQELNTETGQLAQLSFKSYLIDLSSMSDTFKERWKEPRERTMYELMHPEGADADPAVVKRFISEFHLRLTLPFLALTFCFIACALMLTGQFQRRGMTSKMVVAALVIIAIESTMLSLINLINKQPDLVPLLYVLSLAPVPFCWVMLQGRPLPPLPPRHPPEGIV